MSLFSTGRVRYSHVECDFNMHECEFYSQIVIYTRRVLFPNAECDFHVNLCDFDMHECDYDTHEYDFYTKNVISTDKTCLQHTQV
jgi:hypothetical protein